MSAPSDNSPAKLNRKKAGKVLQEAISAHQAGRLDDAEAAYAQILAVDPRNVDALAFLGNLRLQCGAKDEALPLLERALRIKPDYGFALNSRGSALLALGRLSEAEASFRKAIAGGPDFLEAHYNLGVVLQERGRFEDATVAYRQALSIDPRYVGALNNLGTVLRAQGLVKEALECYGRALEHAPARADLHNNRGVALQYLGRLPEALESYESALRLAPSYPSAFNNRGQVLYQLKRYDEALDNYDRAVAADPDFADALSNRGVVLRELGRYEECLRAFEVVAAKCPNHFEAHLNIGAMLEELGRSAEAGTWHDRAVELALDPAQALRNRGIGLASQKKFEAAAIDLERAVDLSPELPHLMGSVVFLKLTLADWEGLDGRMRALLDLGAKDPGVSLPFELLSTPASLALLRRCAEKHVAQRFPMRRVIAPTRPRPKGPGDRIRIGYVSSDFRNHAVTHLVQGLLAGHDRSRFEVVGIACGTPHDDKYRQAIIASCDRFVTVPRQQDEPTIRAIQALGLDIAIDLNGHTKEAGTALFAGRIAPIQVGYLGYPGTSGAGYFDYLLADELVVPEAHRAYYSEKIAYLPGCFQVNSPRPVLERNFFREELGLPAEGVVFCSFNNGYKMTPDAFDVWMRLLTDVPGSVLWLRDWHPVATRNLQREAARRGVDPARLVFAGHTGFEEHHARLRAADLFLDSFHYGAHTTAGDALWAGVPVITRCGETFASRVAASLLTAAGLPELITSSTEVYEALARELGRQPELLMGLKRRLEATRSESPLFNTALCTRNIEAAYAQMWARAVSGELPAHLYI